MNLFKVLASAVIYLFCVSLGPAQAGAAGGLNVSAVSVSSVTVNIVLNNSLEISDIVYTASNTVNDFSLPDGIAIKSAELHNAILVSIQNMIPESKVSGMVSYKVNMQPLRPINNSAKQETGCTVAFNGVMTVECTILEYEKTVRVIWPDSFDFLSLPFKKSIDKSILSKYKSIR